MRAVVAGLLRDSGPASSGSSARAQQGSAAEPAPPQDDDSLVDGLPLAGDLCELEPADLEDLLADPEVHAFGVQAACPPLVCC